MKVEDKNKDEKVKISVVITQCDFDFLQKKRDELYKKTHKNATFTDAVKKVIREHPDYKE